MKLLSNNLLAHTNCSEKFYQNFHENNRLPPVLYYNVKDGQVRVTQLEEDQNTINDNLLKEIENGYVNTIHRSKGILKNKDQQIYEIVQLYKKNQMQPP